MVSFSLLVMLLIAVTFPTLCIWLYFLLYLLISFKESPILEDSTKQNRNNKPPKVSIILAARNEEKYIAKCVESLLKQDYPNFEIITVDDSSSDSTYKIMQTYQLLNSDKMTVINAGQPSDEWTGKNWACYQGYLNATGEVFLFTDADTTVSASTVSLAVGHLDNEGLDALTVRPNIKCESLCGKIMIPVLWTFSHIKYSALRVNNNKVKEAGYFFGCFFLITRKTYESIGTHKEVKNEIIEDAALGNRVKQLGYKMKMYRGERHINTILSADFAAILQGLKRSLNLIPFSKNSIVNIVLTWLLLANPVLLISSVLLIVYLYNISAECFLLNHLLLIIDSITMFIIVLTFTIQSKIGLSQNLVYGFVSPVAGLFVSIVFTLLIVNQKMTGGCNIEWRGRQYAITKNTYTYTEYSKRK
jgi:chlorobactene glucosyltransferase